MFVPSAQILYLILNKYCWRSNNNDNNNIFNNNNNNIHNTYSINDQLLLEMILLAIRGGNNKIQLKKKEGKQ